VSGPLPFVLEWRKAVAASDLSSSERHVAHALSLHMNGAGGSCWPGVQLLAGETGYSDRCVQRALARLHAKGWVDRAERRGKPTVYTATIPRGRTSFGGDTASPLRSVGGDTSSPPPPNLDPSTPEPRSPEVAIEEASEEETAAVRSPPARDGGGADLEPQTFIEAVQALGLTDTQRATAFEAFTENERGFLRVVEEARRGRSPAGLLMDKIRRGDHRGNGGRRYVTAADVLAGATPDPEAAILAEAGALVDEGVLEERP